MINKNSMKQLCKDVFMISLFVCLLCLFDGSTETNDDIYDVENYKSDVKVSEEVHHNCYNCPTHYNNKLEVFKE